MLGPSPSFLFLATLFLGCGGNAVKANIQANTFVVSGSAEERKVTQADLVREMEGSFPGAFPGGLPAGVSQQDFLQQIKSMQSQQGASGGGEEDMPDLEVGASN